MHVTTINGENHEFERKQRRGIFEDLRGKGEGEII